MESYDRRLVLVGGGGHCRSVLDSILARADFSRIGIVDIDPHSERGVPYLGNDGDLPRLYAEGWRCAAVTLGSIGNVSKRRALFETLRRIGFSLPVIIDPSAIVSEDALLHEGVFVGKRVIVNAGARAGMGAILNSGCVIEHDAHIGELAHISPGAVLCGGAVVEDGAHIGANATVIQSRRVGANALVGAGSVVVHDVEANCLAYGNPCREVRKL